MLHIPLTEGLRSRLCQVLAAIFQIVAVLGIFIAGVSGYLYISMTKYTEIVEGYDGNGFFIFVLSTGLYVTVIHVSGGILLFRVSDPAKRSKGLTTLLLVLNIALLLGAILELVGAVLCFTHISHLHDSFKDGITLAMGQYACKLLFFILNSKPKA